MSVDSTTDTLRASKRWVRTQNRRLPWDRLGTGIGLSSLGLHLVTSAVGVGALLEAMLEESEQLKDGKDGEHGPDKETEGSSCLRCLVRAAASDCASVNTDEGGQSNRAGKPKECANGQQRQRNNAVVQRGHDNRYNTEVDEYENGPDGVEEHEVDLGRRAEAIAVAPAIVVAATGGIDNCAKCTVSTFIQNVGVGAWVQHGLYCHIPYARRPKEMMSNRAMAPTRASLRTPGISIAYV